ASTNIGDAHEICDFDVVLNELDLNALEAKAQLETLESKLDDIKNMVEICMSSDKERA
ncbi:MAG: hypothetical protein GQ475_06575, partial [Methylococcaceae bacterium]|nr:hypothetical protein [Methylococcaceae bacterium]